jgi:hypothetical protein
LVFWEGRALLFVLLLELVTLTMPAMGALPFVLAALLTPVGLLTRVTGELAFGTEACPVGTFKSTNINKLEENEKLRPKNPFLY